MKLIIAIVHDDYANKVIKSLMSKKYRITKLSSTGGFLKSGNTTLLAGVEDDKVDDVVMIIEAECLGGRGKRKDRLASGGANIFVLDTDRYKKV